MPNYDETVEFFMPEGQGTAKGTNFTTGSKGGGKLAGAASDEYSRGLEQKRDENIIRDFGMEGLVTYYDKRIKRDQAEQAERDALKTRGLQQEKLAAESMKLTGEALKAMSEARMGPERPKLGEWDIAQIAAGPQQPGESLQDWAKKVAGTKGGFPGLAPVQPAATDITAARDRQTRITQTESILSPDIWGQVEKTWGGPSAIPGRGLVRGALNTLDWLSPEQRFLQTVVDKMALKERHDMFGATLSAGENVIASKIIPSMNMPPNQLKTILQMNLALDKWHDGLMQFLEGKPRKEVQQLSAEYRKHYPFPVNDVMIKQGMGGGSGNTSEKAFREKWGR
jgi:hypothetical protein